VIEPRLRVNVKVTSPTASGGRTCHRPECQDREKRDGRHTDSNKCQRTSGTGRPDRRAARKAWNCAGRQAMQCGLPGGHSRARSPCDQTAAMRCTARLRAAQPSNAGYLSGSTAWAATAVPDLTCFSCVQLNAQVLLPICKDNRMISIRQLTFEKSIFVFATRLKMQVKGISDSRIGNSVKNAGRPYVSVSES